MEKEANGVKLQKAFKITEIVIGDSFVVGGELKAKRERLVGGTYLSARGLKISDT